MSNTADIAEPMIGLKNFIFTLYVAYCVYHPLAQHHILHLSRQLYLVQLPPHYQQWVLVFQLLVPFLGKNLFVLCVEILN